MASLALEGISKSFPGVCALQEVDIGIQAGEIHALCGENGAGKSTLMNVISGNLQPDSGKIFLDGRHVVIPSPQKAFAYGIATVHQHLSIVDNLSVAENIFANRPPVNRWGLIQFKKLYDATQSLLKELLMDDLDPRKLAGSLSHGHRQMVEIAKALAKHPSILLLDEPTASLSAGETKTLFRLLRKLRDQGTTIIYISHRLDEVYLIADRITILKDGVSQGTFAKQALPREALIRRMVGRDITDLRSSSFASDKVVLSLKNVSGEKFSNISFMLRRGEILGFAGLVGAGRTEIARAIFGAGKVRTGQILLEDKRVNFRHPSEAISHGIAYVPEDRKALGLFTSMSVADNIISGNPQKALKDGLYNQEKRDALAVSWKEKLTIATPDINQKVLHLSGGNQQKVVLAKWLSTDPKILIVDEPTHGIDIGVKFQVYAILQSLAAQGKSILVISSDLPELLGLCDRIIVIKNGLITATVLREQASEEMIMNLATN